MSNKEFIESALFNISKLSNAYLLDTMTNGFDKIKIIECCDLIREGIDLIEESVELS